MIHKFISYKFIFHLPFAVTDGPHSDPNSVHAKQLDEVEQRYATQDAKDAEQFDNWMQKNDENKEDNGHYIFDDLDSD